MPRIRTINRSVKATQITVLATDITKGECVNRELVVSGIGHATSKLLKLANKILETTEPNIKAVAVTETNETIKHYTMTEQQFINYATETKLD